MAFDVTYRTYWKYWTHEPIEYEYENRFAEYEYEWTRSITPSPPTPLPRSGGEGKDTLGPSLRAREGHRIRLLLARPAECG